METVEIWRKDHPSGPVIINKSDMLKTDVLYSEKPKPEPKAKARSKAK